MQALAQLGQFSTDFYRQRIATVAPRLHYTVLEFEFEPLNNALPENYAAMEPLLKRLFDNARKRKITSLLLPNITLHNALQLHDTWRGDIRFYDPFELLEQHAVAHGLAGSGVIVLGTRYTRSLPVLDESLRRAGLTAKTCDEAVLHRVDRIREQVYANDCSPSAREAFNTIVGDLAQDNTVVIACTELSSILAGHGERVIDLASLQIEAFVAAGVAAAVVDNVPAGA